jgi:L-ascorbate metabolism protein UlaG (beta-lactamase superfamily)
MAAVALGWLGGAGSWPAQGAPEFTSLLHLTNREVRLQLNAAAGQRHRIEVSPDLRAWTGWMTFLGAGLNTHTDSAAPYLESRYYRGLQLSDTNALTGDHVATEAGEVIIHPINHATLVLAWQGKMVYVDPVGSASLYQGLPRADLILVTHDHSDHLSTSTLDAVRATNAAILAPSIVYGKLTTSLRALTTVLANGDRTELWGLSVDAVPAYNLTATHHAQGVGNGYLLTLGNRRIYVSGDTEDTPEMRALTDVEVAFISMNQPYTMTVPKAVNATREFRPKVVYPYHYRNADSTYADLKTFKAQVGTDLGIEVRLRKWY